jgi:hypothetical protein
MILMLVHYICNHSSMACAHHLVFQHYRLWDAKLFVVDREVKDEDALNVSST